MTFRTVVHALAPSMIADPSRLSSPNTGISFVTDSMMMGNDAVPQGGCPARPGYRNSRAAVGPFHVLAGGR